MGVDTVLKIVIAIVIALLVVGAIAGLVAAVGPAVSASQAGMRWLTDDDDVSAINKGWMENDYGSGNMPLFSPGTLVRRTMSLVYPGTGSNGNWAYDASKSDWVFDILGAIAGAVIAWIAVGWLAKLLSGAG